MKIFKAPKVKPLNALKVLKHSKIEFYIIKLQTLQAILKGCFCKLLLIYKIFLEIAGVRVREATDWNGLPARLHSVFVGHRGI